MANLAESPMDRLWDEYSQAFRKFDDLTLARWMAQTLGQLEGHVWRLSHPLIGAYRVASRWAHDRQIWLQRLATAPAAYPESNCCRAPLLPLLTREVLESGLICQHCGDTVVPLAEIPDDLQSPIRGWAESYAPVHAVAHWDEEEQRRVADYDQALETAATQAETMLGFLGTQIVPRLLDFYPAMVWEDQDECLEVRPEDVVVKP